MLNYLERKTDSPKALIILLHGLGSDESDIFGIANYLPKDWYVVSLRATFVRGGGFMWYNVLHTATGPKVSSDQIKISRNKIAEFIKEFKIKNQIQNIPVFLLGFSQGTIMSLDLALTHPELISGFVGIAGRLLNDTVLDINNRQIDKIKNLKILWLHGKQDQVISINEGRKVIEYLQGLGLKDLVFKEYETVHTISQEEIHALQIWLSKIV